jgi:formylglycine-generating enzyme required for sulfatase activity
MGVYEVTRAEFAAFENATGRSPRNPCFSKLTFAKADSDPMVCVSWEEASAYVAWLSRTTGKTYRLPSEAEWEYAARAGTTTARYWGDGDEDICKYANVDSGQDCPDGFRNTAPVGKFAPNAFGLHDMLGNVWEWTADCWNDTHAGAPANGAPRTGDCTRHVLRGGSWSAGPKYARAASRGSAPAKERQSNIGFRIVRVD